LWKTLRYSAVNGVLNMTENEELQLLAKLKSSRLPISAWRAE
jgi:hypothetical protein